MLCLASRPALLHVLSMPCSCVFLDGSYGAGERRGLRRRVLRAGEVCDAFQSLITRRRSSGYGVEFGIRRKGLRRDVEAWDKRWRLAIQGHTMRGRGSRWSALGRGARAWLPVDRRQQ